MDVLSGERERMGSTWGIRVIRDCIWALGGGGRMIGGRCTQPGHAHGPPTAGTGAESLAASRTAVPHNRPHIPEELCGRKCLFCCYWGSMNECAWKDAFTQCPHPLRIVHVTAPQSEAVGVLLCLETAHSVFRH